MSQSQLSRLLQQQLGYSLTVRPSQIEHQEAGEEVCADTWLETIQSCTRCNTSNSQIKCVHMCALVRVLEVDRGEGALTHRAAEQRGFLGSV
jgi:hypothetical protein